MENRLFIPGSEWVYFKIYTGTKTADSILKNELFEFVYEMLNNEIIDKWFFIRYSDPDFHIRLRLHLSLPDFTQIFTHFHETFLPLVDSGSIWNIQCDTYKRELERYGKELIEEAESFFFIDSECIIQIIKILEGSENHRWMIALKLIDELLSDFGLNLEEKQKFMETTGKSFKTEFGFNEHNSKQFNSKFRDNKKTVESVLRDVIQDKDFLQLMQPIKKRSKQLKTIIEKIKTKAGKEKSINELLQSYLHMMLNRLFRSKNRQHELLLYDFMYRYYTSEIAKRKYNK